jgi:hypothetical protein
MLPTMSDMDFDSALIASFFRLVAERGWSGTNVAEAARAAALPLAEARLRFPGRRTRRRWPKLPPRAPSATSCSTC